MGIFGLTKLISEKAPSAIRQSELKHYFGRYIAIDASTCIYQFLIAMKAALGGEAELTNKEGEVTSHLIGMWTRTIRMLSQGLKPIYVFDGKAPTLKALTLEGRREKVANATEALAAATEDGDKEEMIRQNKRTVRATRQQTEECMKLLRLMGVPVVQAEGEAEATCAKLVNSGKCWAVGTEDMDALTFGADRMLRHLTASDNKQQPILEIHLNKVLEGLEMDMSQFIDLCILMGCDYCPKITGIGPSKAYDGIKKYKNIEAFLPHLDSSKYRIPDQYPYKEARQLFVEPSVTDHNEVTVSYSDPDREGLIQFMCEEKMFSKDRIEKGIQKLLEVRTQKTQVRLDSFITVTKTNTTPTTGIKRKAEDTKLAQNKKAKPPARKAVVSTKKK